MDLHFVANTLVCINLNVSISFILMSILSQASIRSVLSDFYCSCQQAYEGLPYLPTLLQQRELLSSIFGSKCYKNAILFNGYNELKLMTIRLRQRLSRQPNFNTVRIPLNVLQPFSKKYSSTLKLTCIKMLMT